MPRYRTPILVPFLLMGLSQTAAQDNRMAGYVSIRGAKLSTMALQSDARIALLGFTSGQAAVFDPLPGKFARFEPFTAHEKSPTAAAFRGDDRWFATGGGDGNVKLWESHVAIKFQVDSINRKDKAPKPIPPEAKHTLKAAHAGGVTALAFSPDGNRLASAGADGSVKIWEVESAKQFVAIEAHAGSVNAVVFAPNGESFATAGADKTFKIWKVNNPDKPALTSPEHKGPVLAVAFSSDGKQIASGSGEAAKSGQVQVWDAGKGKLVHAFAELTDAVTTLSFHPKLPRLASGGKDKKVRVWSLTLKKQLYEDLHKEGLIKVQYSADGKVMGSVCAEEGKWWNGSPKVQ